MPTKQTTGVTVNFTLNSSAAAPPYEVGSCAGQVQFNDGSISPFDGWNSVDIGTPQPNGAAFNLNVIDSNYSANNLTSIVNWALTFIPRTGTSHQSPFDDHANTIAGSGPNTASGNSFGLNLGSVKIKHAGDWDWSLMIQVKMPDGTIKCFSSDPEMEVDG